MSRFNFLLLFFCLLFGCGQEDTLSELPSASSASISPPEVFIEPENGAYITPLHEVLFFISHPGWLEYSVNGADRQKIYVEQGVMAGDFERALPVLVSGYSGHRLSLDYQFIDVYGNLPITGRRVFYVSELSAHEPAVFSQLIIGRTSGLASGNVIGEALAIADGFVVVE